MNDEDDWEETFDDNGITLGPEEILRREIEKSKNLKVERLQLKDEIEKLFGRRVKPANMGRPKKVSSDPTFRGAQKKVSSDPTFWS